MGGLNIRRAALHAPAAYLGSLEQSRPLVERFLGYSFGPPSHLHVFIVALTAAADHPECLSLEDINIPLRQRALSNSIDEASQHHLLSSSNDACEPLLRLQLFLILGIG